MTYTAREKTLLANTDVLGYIQFMNAQRDAQAKAEGWDFWTTMPESADFVAEHANVYELEHMYAVGTFSEMYKEAWGVRPRWDFGKLTLAELEAEIADLCEAADREYQRQIEEEKAERAYRDLCASENARENAQRAEEVRVAEANQKIDMQFSIQDALMGY